MGSEKKFLKLYSNDGSGFNLNRRSAMASGMIRRSLGIEPSRIKFKLNEVDQETTKVVATYLNSNASTKLGGSPKMLLQMFKASKQLDMEEMEKKIREECSSVDRLSLPKHPPLLLPHRHSSLFIPMGWENELCTMMVMKDDFYPGEKRIADDKNVYRIWEPKNSKLCQALSQGLQ